MNLYNSLGREIQALDRGSDPLTVYTCGITPYDTTHLGHAFTYTSVDILIRYLEYLGSKVRYVQNVTDIDDDLLKRAGEVGEDWLALGNIWTAHFIEDMVSLNVRPPEVLPRATDVIPEIIDAVDRLISCGAAYIAGGSVYYAIDRFHEYGKLSRLTYEEMSPIAAERGNRSGDPNKQDPLDFVLWQARAAGEPAWDSPWGPGRPGWHIECSTMAGRFLQIPVDVHAGGSDLAYPHHESEIAQAEACSPDSRFVRHWMHIAMVEYQGEKMSKSLGNLIMVSDLLKTWSPDALRLCLAGHHYREVWSYAPAELESTGAIAARLMEAAMTGGGDRPAPDCSRFSGAFEAAMDSDLLTREAIGVLRELGEAILMASDQSADIRPAQELMRRLGGVLGLSFGSRKGETQAESGWSAHKVRFQAPASSATA